MAIPSFSKETLNFLKYTVIVMRELPNALRQIFTNMWNQEYGSRPGYQFWDDSPAVRNMLLGNEGSRTVIPTTRSIEEWDCTALFKATIYAQSFSLTDPKGNKKTLNDVYLRKSGLATAASFHTSVTSPTGNQNETYALVIDQLRLLRNTLCHSPSCELDQVKFDQYLLLAKDAFNAASIDTSTLEKIANLSQSDFPIEKMQEIKECLLEIREVTQQISRASLRDVASEGETSSQREERNENDLARQYEELLQKYTADSYHAEGKQQCRLGNYEKALSCHKKALSIRRDLYETIHKAAAAISYREIGKIHFRLRQYDLALLSFKSSLAILINSVVYGEQHSETARGHYHVGKVLVYLRDYSSALCSLRKSLDIWKIQGDDCTKEIADVYRAMGAAQTRLGHYAHATESLVSSLEILQQLYGTNHEVTAESYFAVGRAQQRMREFASSIEMYENAIRIGPEYHPRTAACYFYKGVMQSVHGMGGHAEALKSHKRALEIRLEVHGSQHQDTLLSYCYVGRTQLALENNESALRYYLRALQINRTLLRNGEKSGGTAEIYFYIGMAAFNNERYGFALKAHTKFFEIRDAVLSQSTTNGVEELASLSQAQGLITTRAGLERISDGQVAISYSQIGIAQAHDNEDYQSALASHQHAYDIRRRIYGEDHAETQDSYKSIQLMESFL